MKILILTDISFPTDHSFLEEVYNKRLPAYGHELTWLMKSNLPIEKDIEETMWNQNKVILLKSFGVKKLVDSIKTHLKILKNVNKSIKQVNPDVLIVRNDPLMGLIAKRYSRKNNKKFIFQYSFYKSRVHKGKSGINSLLKYHLGSFIEKKLLLGADHVFPISKYMAEEIIHDIKVDPLKITPFTLGVDETLLPEKKDQAIKESLGLGDDVIVYLGALDQTRNPEFLIDTFKLVLNKKPTSQLLLVGDATNKQDIVKLKQYVNSLKLTNSQVVFTGRVPRDSVPKYIALAEVCLSPIPPTPDYKISSPIKIMDYLLNEKPIIVNKEIMEQNNMVENGKCGYTVKYDTENFSESILKILNDKELGREMGRRGREYVIEHRSYQKTTQDINKIIKK